VSSGPTHATSSDGGRSLDEAGDVTCVLMARRGAGAL